MHWWKQINFFLKGEGQALMFFNLIWAFVEFHNYLIIEYHTHLVDHPEKKSIIIQKQPSINILKKRCSKNMQKIYWKAPMLKCDFNKVAKQLRHRCFFCEFGAYFQNNFFKNTYGGLLLVVWNKILKSFHWWLKTL